MVARLVIGLKTYMDMDIHRVSTLNLVARRVQFQALDHLQINIQGFIRQMYADLQR